MKGVFNIMPHKNTSWYGVDLNIVWYVLCTSKALDANIPAKV